MRWLALASIPAATAVSVPEPVSLIKYATAIIVILTIYLLVSKKAPATIFWILSAIIIIPTVYLAGHTIVHNIQSETGGPVHWHADFQLWVCGERVDIQNPTGFNNKIGSPLFHEHNDDRIHVEGTVMQREDVNLGSFFEVIGGSLSSTHMEVPTDEGMLSVQNGDLCNEEEATLKVFVNGNLSEDPTTHEMYEHSLVPPGDCVIVEFSPTDATTTNNICESWAVSGWGYNNYTELRE